MDSIFDGNIHSRRNVLFVFPKCNDAHNLTNRSEQVGLSDDTDV